MEVCQTGIDEVIPAWCVDYEIGPSFILQGMLELVILFVFGWIMYKIFNFRKKKKMKRGKGNENQTEYPPIGWKKI